MSDLISRQDAINCVGWGDSVTTVIDRIKALPSKITEYKTFCGVPIEEASRIVHEHNAEPKTEMVLCALADRACPFQGKEYAWCLTCPHISEEDMALVKKAVTEPKTGWIPIKWHEITEEEREREGYPKDWVVHIDCDMPCDGDEILVQTKNGYIRWDVCYEEGEFSLDSGWDWIEDIVAWMPLPEPYKGGDTE